MESPLACGYGQAGYSVQLFHIQALFSISWGKVCLNILLHQDSGYGGDIWVSTLYGTQCDKHHVQIVELPCSKHSISPPTHSPTGIARGTLPFGLLEKINVTESLTLRFNSDARVSPTTNPFWSFSTRKLPSLIF